MKKIILIILLLFPLNIYAYTNDYFTLDIPDTYNDVDINKNTYKWTSKNDDEIPNIIVTISNNNPTNIQNVDDFSDELLLEYKNTIKETLNSSLKDYNLEISVSDIKKEKINNYTVLTYTTIWPTKNTYTYDMYQKSYVITTQKYITTLIYTTKNESDQLSNDIRKILDSLIIKDEKLLDNSFFAKRRNQMLVVGIVAGIIGYIASALKKRKTTKNK